MEKHYTKHKRACFIWDTSHSYQFTNPFQVRLQTNMYILCCFTQTDTGNNVLLVRALDRFHRRLQAVHKLLPDIGSSRSV